jgi:hypothetical protein
MWTSMHPLFGLTAILARRRTIFLIHAKSQHHIYLKRALGRPFDTALAPAPHAASVGALPSARNGSALEESRGFR